MNLAQLQGLAGVVLIVGLCWLLSENRHARPSLRWIGLAISAQFFLAILIVRVPLVWEGVTLLNHAVVAIERATRVGSSYMFGYLGGAPLPFALLPGEAPPVVIAFQILPLVIVFSAISALLWHWGILSWMVRRLGRLLERTLGVSGVVGLGGGATLFLGVVETPLIIRAYLGRISRAELFATMVMIMATISGAILILYATTLSRAVPDAVGHMISASIISLPAAILVARLLVSGDGATMADSEGPSLSYAGSMDAIVRGTQDGVQLFLAVIGMIIVVFALVALADQMLAVLPEIGGQPLMRTPGVPWAEAPAAGALMGTKAILNEYVAYLDLAALPPGSFAPRSALIVTYALCGVANLASVGLLVSTIGTLAPERRAEVAALGMKSWLAGNLASSLTGAVIGIVTWPRCSTHGCAR